MATYDYYVSRRDTAGEAFRAIRWSNNEKDTNDLVDFLNSTKVKVVEKRLNAQSLTLKLSSGTNLNIPTDSFLLLSKNGMVAVQPDAAFREGFIRKSEVGDRAGQPIPYSRSKRTSSAKDSPKGSADREKLDFIKNAKGSLEVYGLAQYSEVLQRFSENKAPNLDMPVLTQGMALVIDKALFHTMSFCQEMGIPGEVIPTEIFERMLSVGAIGLWPQIREAIPEEDRAFGKAVWVSLLSKFVKVVRAEGHKGTTRQLSVGMGTANPKSSAKEKKTSSTKASAKENSKVINELVAQLEEESGDKIDVISALGKSWIVNHVGKTRQIICLGDFEGERATLVYDDSPMGVEKVSEKGYPFWRDAHNMVCAEEMADLLEATPNIAIIKNLRVDVEVDDMGRTVSFLERSQRVAFYQMIRRLLDLIDKGDFQKLNS